MEVLHWMPAAEQTLDRHSRVRVRFSGMGSWLPLGSHSAARRSTPPLRFDHEFTLPKVGQSTSNVVPTDRLGVGDSAHLSTKPARPPRAVAHCSTTPLTTPGRLMMGGPLSSWTRRSHAVRGPSATTSTRPSSRFVARPARPSSSARDLTHHRNPTPCTRPRTQTVTRARSPRSVSFTAETVPSAVARDQHTI